MGSQAAAAGRKQPGPIRENEVMYQRLRVGQRVRVTGRNHLYGYRVGDKGEVLRAFMGSATGDIYYSVVMDKDKLTITGAIFTEDEIEPDV